MLLLFCAMDQNAGKNRTPKNSDFSAFYSNNGIIYRYAIKDLKNVDFTPLKRYHIKSVYHGTVNTFINQTVINNTLIYRSDRILVYIMIYYAPCRTLINRSVVNRSSICRSGAAWVVPDAVGSSVLRRSALSAPFCDS